MKTGYILPGAALWFLLLTWSCSNSTAVDESASRRLVVQAYLFSGQPVGNIQLTTTFPLSSTDSIAPPVNDAAVTLIKNEQRYALTNTNESGFYHYPGTDLSVDPGDIFHLEVNYREAVITASTIVPAVPGNIHISDDLLLIQETVNPLPDIEMAWDIPGFGGDYFLVVIENIDTNPRMLEGINHNPPLVTPRGIFIGASEAHLTLPFTSKGISRLPQVDDPDLFISYPTSAQTFSITPAELTHSGKHLARVFRINQEYADLYISQQQNAHDLNETLSNIRNGLGIFTAFSSSDSLFFRVRQK